MRNGAQKLFFNSHALWIVVGFSGNGDCWAEKYVVGTLWGKWIVNLINQLQMSPSQTALMLEKVVREVRCEVLEGIAVTGYWSLWREPELRMNYKLNW